MRFGFLGGGKIAEAILSAIPSKKSVIVAERAAARRAELAAKYQIRAVDDLKGVFRLADIIFLAVNPRDIEAVARVAKPFCTSSKTIVSVVPGKRLFRLRRLFGDKVALARAMPNIGLLAKAGMTAICSESKIGKEEMSAIVEVFGASGEVVYLKEQFMDMMAAMGTGGLVCFAHLAKMLAEEGVDRGLTPEQARNAATQTLLGAGKLLRESGGDIQTFIDGMCVRGSVPATGLETFAGSDVKVAVNNMFNAVVARIKEK